MGKVVITGPGRSGTTFLVQLLTRLGFDTGYEPGAEPYGTAMRAGCEQRIELDADAPVEVWKAAMAQAPRVLKSPEWGLVMKGFVLTGRMEVDHCFIPFRDLDVAARSRLDAGLDWQVCKTDDYEYRVMDQASVHALAFGRALEACLVCGIPCTIMRFPRLVEDEDYCYKCLARGLEIDRDEHRRVFAELARPQQIKWGKAAAGDNL